jgi:hypothetical protein
VLLHQLVKYLQKHSAVKINVLRCIFTPNLIILYAKTGLWYRRVHFLTRVCVPQSNIV